MCWVLDRSVSKENGSPTLQALVSVGVLCGLFAGVRLLGQKGKPRVMPERGSGGRVSGNYPWLVRNETVAVLVG